MAVSAEPTPRRYTYADLDAFPDDHIRRDIIDGELFVSPSPILRHQRASKDVHFRLIEYERRAGGESFASRCDVFFSDSNVVEPDLLFIRADHLAEKGVWKEGAKRIEGAPDLVVEISSPSTRRRDQALKRDLYERFGVAEYWFVDLRKECVEVYVLSEGSYLAPQIKLAGETLEPAGLPGLSISVTEALAAEGPKA